MKTLFKAIAIASLASTATVAQADATATLGVNSSYMFRGTEMADGNTTYANLGFDLAGLSVGITMTDNDGGGDFQNGDANTETDIVIGYSMNVMGTDVRLSYTDYSYEFAGDDQRDGEGQTEFAVGITASGLSIDYVDGEDTLSGNDIDFDVLTLGYTVGNVDFTLGQVDSDAVTVGEYNYYEISTGTELFGLDAHVMVTNTFSEDVGGDNGATLVVGVSKSLSL